jgi:hypothetical protein
MANTSRAKEIIEVLNGITVGELETIRNKLSIVRKDLIELGLVDLSVDIQDAGRKLSKGDVVAFRKLLAKVVSKLGHHEEQ